MKVPLFFKQITQALIRILEFLALLKNAVRLVWYLASFRAACSRNISSIPPSLIWVKFIFPMSLALTHIEPWAEVLLLAGALLVLVLGVLELVLVEVWLLLLLLLLSVVLSVLLEATVSDGVELSISVLFTDVPFTSVSAYITLELKNAKQIVNTKTICKFREILPPPCQ